MGLSGCYGMAKYLVVLVNFIFWLVGLTIVVVAVRMMTDATFYLSMAQDPVNYDIGLYILLAIGALMLIVAFLGCCGAFKESRCMLVSFFSCLLIIFVAELAAGAWAYYNADELKTIIHVTVRTTVQKEYRSVPGRNITFDAIQSGLQCCGADGPTDWNALMADEDGDLELSVSSDHADFKIPASCCRPNITTKLCDDARSGKVGKDFTEEIFQDGCSEKLVQAIVDQMTTIMLIGLGLLILEFLGLILSCVLCYAINSTDRYKA